MRAAFLLAVLALAGGYTAVAFADLSWTSSAGRLGPGFFPRIIGLCLVALCLYSLYADRARKAEMQVTARGAAMAIALLSAGFIALLNVLGGPLSMVLFMGAALHVFNRGKTLQNAVIALVLPGIVYLVFRVWLNAAMPRGLLPLPF